jgi:hypothetical protein
MRLGFRCLTKRPGQGEGFRFVKFSSGCEKFAIAHRFKHNQSRQEWQRRRAEEGDDEFSLETDFYKFHASMVAFELPWLQKLLPSN